MVAASNNTEIYTIIASILGIILTFIQVKKNFKDEIKAKKQEKQVEKMSEIAIDIMDFINKVNEKNQDIELLRDMIRFIRSEIFAFCTKDAVRLFSIISKEHFNNDMDKENKYRLSVLYPLLISQIRYDSIGEAVSPDFWYQMYITDYPNHKDEFKEENNRCVKELNLNRKFLI